MNSVRLYDAIQYGNKLDMNRARTKQQCADLFNKSFAIVDHCDLRYEHANS